MSATPKLDLTHDPERLATIVAAPFVRPSLGEAVIVSGTLPNGRSVYARVARAVVEASGATVPAPIAAPRRPQAPRQTPVTAEPSPRSPVDAIAANLARTPVRVPAPAPPTRPAAPAARANVDRLLALTPLGRDVLDRRRRQEQEAAARAPAPISARVRACLEATHPGRQVLADRRRRDPEGEAQAGGLDPARRRELLGGSDLGRAILAAGARR